MKINKHIKASEYHIAKARARSAQFGLDWESEFYQKPMYQCSGCFETYTHIDFDLMLSVWVDPSTKKSREMYGKVHCCPKCGKRFHMDKWQIMSKVDNHMISTVHLELAHTSVTNWLDDSPHWYETMIWTVDHNFKTQKWLDFQQRYKTMEEAIKGHEFAVKNIHRIIENPEEHPMSIISMFGNAIDRAHYEKDKLTQEEKEKAT